MSRSRWLDLSRLSTYPRRFGRPLMVWICFPDQFGNGANLFTTVLDTAFPDNEDMPSRLIQCLVRISITTSIALKLGLPERRPGLWHRGIETIGMPMPETAVYKYRQIMARKNKIRRAREILAMQPEAVSTRMQILSKNKLRMSIPSLNGSHHAGASRGINNISHHFRLVVSVSILQI